jgi:hypothetical protein
VPKRKTPLVQWPPYKRAHECLHRVWSRAKGQPDYTKPEWLELEAAIVDLANIAQR